MHKYKVGDRVKLKNMRGPWWSKDGEMDKYIGAEVIIDRLTGSDIFQIPGEGWWFKIDDIEERVFEPQDLQTGDIVKYKNGETALVLIIPNLGRQLQREKECISLKHYNENMENSFRPQRSIVKVYRPIRSNTLIGDGVDLEDTSHFQLMWVAKVQRYYLIDEFMSTKGNPKYLACDRHSGEYHLSTERDLKGYYTEFTMEEIKEGEIPLNRFRLVPVEGE